MVLFPCTAAALAAPPDSGEEAFLVHAPFSCDRGLAHDVLGRLRDMNHFLRERSRGLPFAPDPRSLEPASEVVRLIVDAQALGYLELYALTHRTRDLEEAEKRLRWISLLGDSAFRGAGLDGQVGWSHLRAYELTRDPEQLRCGLAVADRCLGYEDRIPNWAYAAALNLGKAHGLTGDVRYLAAARRLARGVAGLQFPDGAFPHRDGRVFGENSPYTSWLVFEMIQHRRDDPGDPEIDPAILKAAAFLARRVAADGSLDYRDSAGVYDSNPFDTDCRGWMSELPAVAFVLEATGRHEPAHRVLRFLLAQVDQGRERGGCADKWGYPDSSSPWATGDPSVVRTSLVFWMLAACLREMHVAGNGTTRACAITPDDCAPAFRDLAMCDAGLLGHDVVVDGRSTGCLDEALVRYISRDTCDRAMTCEYQAGQDEYLVTVCPTLGDRKCVASACRDSCVNPYPVSCSTSWSRQDLCVDTRSAMGTGSVRAGTGAGRTPTDPVCGAVTVPLELARGGLVRAVVFDVAGRRLSRLDVGFLPAGTHRVRIDVPRGPGVYLVRLGIVGQAPTTCRFTVVR